MGEAAAFKPPEPTAATVLGQTFPTGWGKHETRAPFLHCGKPNPNSDAGKPYATISAPEIVGMVRNPPAAVPKDRAQWFIPSRYNSSDARSHDAQRERGSFAWLALDVDTNNLPLGDVRQALEAVLGACSFLIYSTSSATPENRKWRALIPLKHDVAGADYTDTADAFFDLLEQASQGTLICDRALARTGQAIYLPNPLSGFYQHAIAQTERADLTPHHSVIVRRQEQRQRRQVAEAEAKAQQAQRRAEAPHGGIDDASPVHAFNAAHSVAELLGRYGYTQAGAINDWKSPLQSSGSFATRDYGDHWISLSASDAAAGLGRATKNGARFGDAFDLFCHFEHGGDCKKAVAAYGAEIRPSKGFQGRGKIGGGDEHSAAASVPSKGRNKEPREKVDRVKWCADVACTILEESADWRGVLAHNEFTGLDMLLKPIPGTTVPRSTFAPRPLTDNDITAAVRWFNRNGFPDATKNGTADALFLVAGESIISPVRHFLEGLNWDGVQRVADWLTRYCGAEPAELTAKVGKAWLVAAVARALKPGCKADCALVLEGRQGAGKSSILRALAGDDWFSDSLRDMHGKDASAALRGKWIIELPELSAMRRSDTEAVKAFLSRIEERYRPAYGRTEVIEPRRCIFAGTTNRNDYLTDDTGGRRFWPVVVGAVDLDALSRDREQLWAEAVALYRAGERWWLDRKDEGTAAAVVATRAADDPWAADVLRAVEGLSEVSTRDVFQLLEIPLERRSTSDAMRIAGIITRAGWVRSGKFTGGPSRDLARFLPPDGGSHE